MHIDAMVSEIVSYSFSIDKPVACVEFGVSTNLQTPYVVVKQELGFFRVTTHMDPGEESALRVYVRKDLSNALEDKTLQDGTDKFRVRVNAEDVPDPIFNGNDDGSISQERLFSVADRI